MMSQAKEAKLAAKKAKSKAKNEKKKILGGIAAEAASLAHLKKTSADKSSEGTASIADVAAGEKNKKDIMELTIEGKNTGDDSKSGDVGLASLAAAAAKKQSENEDDIKTSMGSVIVAVKHQMNDDGEGKLNEEGMKVSPKEQKSKSDLNGSNPLGGGIAKLAAAAAKKRAVKCEEKERNTGIGIISSIKKNMAASTDDKDAKEGKIGSMLTPTLDQNQNTTSKDNIGSIGGGGIAALAAAAARKRSTKSVDDDKGSGGIAALAASAARARNSKSNTDGVDTEYRANVAMTTADVNRRNKVIQDDGEDLVGGGIAALAAASARSRSMKKSEIAKSIVVEASNNKDNIGSIGGGGIAALAAAAARKRTKIVQGAVLERDCEIRSLDKKVRWKIFLLVLYLQGIFACDNLVSITEI